MFDPVIEKAIALIDLQRSTLKKEKKPIFKVICLCGGLGSSDYVEFRFQEYIDTVLIGQCMLVKNSRAWSAVVRGAAIRGLDGSFVLAKKSKCFYGIGVHQAFEEGVDDEAKSFICPIKGKRADGYVDWVVKK